MVDRAHGGRDGPVRALAHSVIDIGLRRRLSPQGGLACSVADRAFVVIEAAWTSTADDGRNQQWMNDVFCRLQPRDKGACINETDRDRRPESFARCVSPDALDRLMDIKSRDDPTNVFVTPLDRRLTELTERRL